MYLLPLFTRPYITDSDHLIIINLKRVHSSCIISNSQIFLYFVKFAFLPPLSFNCDVVANKYEKKIHTCPVVRLVIALKREGGGVTVVTLIFVGINF